MRKLVLIFAVAVMMVSCTSTSMNDELEGLNEQEIQLRKKGGVQSPGQKGK